MVFSTLSFLIAEIKLSYCRRYCGVFLEKSTRYLREKETFTFTDRKRVNLETMNRKGVNLENVDRN